MKIHLLLFVSSIHAESPRKETLVKTVESDIRPVQGDILDDPGFHPGFHNGYEVVKVTLNYATNECFVSLTPLMVEKEEISVDAYVERLQEHGWRVLSKEELQGKRI